MKFKIWWIDKQRDPQNPPDPAYPKGIDVDLSGDAEKTCKTRLPYPTPRCGVFLVVCQQCGLTVSVTTAGRADDPRSLKVACKSKLQ